MGGGHISNILKEYGYEVINTDIVDRGCDGYKPFDFLSDSTDTFYGDIITNPPYKYAKEFVYKALESVANGYKVAMLLRLQFLEGKTRRALFDEYPPETIYVSSSRLTCAINGDFENCQSSPIAYAWFVWQKGYKGDTVIKWIN